MSLFIAERQAGKKAVNINFCNIWFRPTGNQTRVYRFCNRRSIHSTHLQY